MILLSYSSIQAQNEAAEDQDDGEELVSLTPFVLTEEDDSSYAAGNIISGTRNQTRLKYFPQNIAVITNALLEDTAAFNTEQAVLYVSNVSNENNDEGQLDIRGWRAPHYRNGVEFFTGGEVAISVDTVFIDRIEVVKGPSTLLYGAAQPGGIVNLITKKPLAENKNSIAFVAGSDKFFRFEYDSTGPIFENKEKGSSLLYRMVGLYSDKGSFREFEEESKFIVAPSLTWNIDDKTSISMELFFSRLDEITGRNNRPFENDFSAPLPGVPLSFNPNNPENFKNSEEINVTINFVRKFNDWLSLRSTYFYQEAFKHELNVAGVRETSPGVIPAFWIDWINDSQRYSVETNLLGQFQNVGPGNFELLIGHQFRKIVRNKLYQNWSGATDFHIFDLEQQAIDRQRPPEDTFTVRRDDDIREEGSNSFYFTGNYNVLFNNDRQWRIFGGGRWTELAARTVKSLSGVSESDAQTQFTAQIGSSFTFNKDITGFFTYSESIIPNVQSATPQSGSGFETGIKFDLLDRKLSGSISYFNAEKSNIERRDFFNPEFTSLAGKEESKGIEAELYINPTKNWTMILSGGYLDSEIVEDPQLPLNEGAPLPAPNGTFTMWNKYTVREGSLAGLYAGFGYLWRGEKRSTIGEAISGGLIIPDYSRYDVTVGYRGKLFGDKVYTISAFLENLADTFYLDHGTRAGAPRNLRVSFKIEY